MRDYLILTCLMVFTTYNPLNADCLDPDIYENERSNLVDELEKQGIHDQNILTIFKYIKRHLFMPTTTWKQAYENCPVPIGYGQTISQPYIVALMTEKLNVQPTDRILEVGTGSGYQAAILAELAQHVYTVEIVPELAQRAEHALKEHGIRNVHVYTGDGYKGLPEKAPFDKIILTAAPEIVPEALKQQLKLGGLMIAPVGVQGDIQKLILIERLSQNQFSETTITDVRFVPMVKPAVTSSKQGEVNPGG